MFLRETDNRRPTRNAGAARVPFMGVKRWRGRVLSRTSIDLLVLEPFLPAPHDGFGAQVPRMIALVPSPSAVSKMMFARQT